MVQGADAFPPEADGVVDLLTDQQRAQAVGDGRQAFGGSPAWVVDPTLADARQPGVGVDQHQHRLARLQLADGHTHRRGDRRAQ